ncbi:hypothetical protein LshimejAT787_0603890 [Lyophyllum shimeji]|uniref:Uncharacterized protein n=1 Tax=Lyophyllum shimeji TaxID=47721 RepID=A0A9P3PPX2_LYOSH|nr:hypothetical protein LshimejAT787_0603890 [Lyophyllum shimeji]
MALSVSGFPEPLRHTPADTDGEPTLSLANNAMLRGLFGKKAESKPLPRQNTDEAIPPSPSLPFSSAPRTSQMLASASTDEQALLAQMEILQAPEPLPPIPIPHQHQHQRPRQISLTRRTPPPVRRQPSLGRLEIGSAPRAAANGTPLHALPKPPSVVEQGWKSQEPTSTLAHPRPLPAVPTPGPIIESSKSAAMRAAAVTHRPPPSKVIMTGSSRPRAQTTAPHAVSVRYQSMAVDPMETEGAGPPSSSSSASAAAPSSSSPSSSMAGSTFTMPNTNTNNNTANAHVTITPTQAQVVRPLPRIPPASAVQPFSHRLPPHVPRPARVKRPKTSPSSSAGFGSTVRSPFDAVPTSWASRPVDLSPSQPGPSTSPSATGPSSHASSTQASSSSSSYASGSTSRQVPRALPHPHPHPHPHPRTRSVSRTRVSASGSGSRSAATSPIRRTLPSPSSTSTPATPVLGSMSISPRRTPTHSGSVSGSGYSSPSSPTASPRLPPPNRFLADRGAPSTAKIDEESASIRSQAQESSGGGRPGTAESRPSHEHPAMSDIDLLDGGTEGDGDPLGPFMDDQDHASLLSRSPSPMRYARPSSRGSLSLSEEEYLSDSLSRSRSRSRHRGRGRGQQLRAFRHSYRAPPANPERSPSPIKYARRRSLELDADVDVDVESVFGFGIGDGGEGGADEDGDGDGEMTPVDGRARRPPRRHTQPRSYQFDYRAAMESSPFLWNAGARAEESKGGGKEGKDKEREKEREKQRKKDTKEKARKSAGSSTVKRSKSKGSSKQSKSQTNSLTHSIRSTASKGSGRRSRSRSPRGRSGMGTPTGSVIDISSPTTKESYHEFTQGKEKEKLLGLGLGRKDSKRGGGAGKERESEKDGELRRLKTHTHMHKHKERAGRASLSGILPDVAMSWGVGGAVKEKDKEKEREKEKEKEGVSGRLGGAWRELVPLRRGSEAEWVGVGLGQVYEGDSANAVVVAAIQRG